MRFWGYYSWSTILLQAANWSPVIADRYAVLPRQDATTTSIATSSSTFVPSSSTLTKDNPSSTSSSKIASSQSTSVSSQTSGKSSASSASKTDTNADSTGSSSITQTPTATPITNSTFNGTLTNVPQIDGLPIHPQITPALSVAGALLIVTGAFYTVIGIKTKWLHVFLSTAYLFSLSVSVLVIYVMHPPISNAVQGAYFVAAVITGLVFGGVAVVFADVTEGLGCFLGGFCLAMWFLVLKPGGLIASTAGKVIFIACFTVGTFSLYVSHYTRPYGLIGSTSFAGATVVLLGVDMFSRAGLKEFWLYIWDLNDGIFPLHYDGPYPITRGIRVEIASIILFFLLGIMSQMKVWKIIQKRREQRSAEQRRKDLERDQADETLGRKLEERNDQDRAMWDAVYGSKFKGSQLDSGIGTDEPSTRKGSLNIVDTREGMEMQNIDSSDSSQKKGRVTIHVAEDNNDEEMPSPSEAKSKAGASKEPSLNESEVSASRSIASENAPVDASHTELKKKDRPVSDRHLPPMPKLVPLPFNIPVEPIPSQDDDNSSVATFAASEGGVGQKPQRMSGSYLLRKLSGRSKRSSMAQSISAEALIVPHIEDDRASSAAATLDGVSIHNLSQEALSSQDQRPISLVFKTDGAATEIQDSSRPDDVDTAPSRVHHEAAEQILASDKHSAPPMLLPTANLKDSAHEDTKNDSSFKQVPGAKTATSSENLDEPGARAGLVGHLPGGASKVVTAFRTNEWAKHLDDAEVPKVDYIKPNNPKITSTSETTAPVNVESLQQTPLTAAPAPLPNIPLDSKDDKTQLSSPKESSTHTDYFSKHPLRQKGSSVSPTSTAPPVTRTPSQTSLSSTDSAPDKTAQPAVPKNRSSLTSLGPSRNGFRSSSTPMISSPLTESPIEEGVESSFPARFTPSPMHLMSQRDSLIRNKPSSTSLQGRTTPSTLLRRSTSAIASSNTLNTTTTTTPITTAHFHANQRR